MKIKDQLEKVRAKASNISHKEVLEEMEIVKKITKTEQKAMAICFSTVMETYRQLKDAEDFDFKQFMVNIVLVVYSQGYKNGLKKGLKGK